MYSRTARVQCSAAQWEVRSLSTPFIHSLIQSEGNYRPPEASRSSLVCAPTREPRRVRSPSTAPGDVCIDVLCVKQQQIDEEAFSVATSRFRRLRRRIVYRLVRRDVTRRNKLLSLTRSFAPSRRRIVFSWDLELLRNHTASFVVGFICYLL